MRVFSRVILIIAVINLLVCSGLSVYYYINPSQFNEGELFNLVAFLTGTGCFVVNLSIFVIYNYILDRTLKDKRTELLVFNGFTIPFYIILVANTIYRFIAAPKNDLGSATTAKVIAGLALAMLLDSFVINMTSNYLKRV